MQPEPARFPPTLRWSDDIDGHLLLIDQTLLPVEFREIECRHVEAGWEAIKSLRVRGAPAIGIAASIPASAWDCKPCRVAVPTNSLRVSRK